MIALLLAKVPRFRLIRRETWRDALGRQMPRGYGLAWTEITRREYVLMPVPLNVLAGIARHVWHLLLGGFWPTRIDRALSRAYHNGIQEGERAGRDWALREWLMSDWRRALKNGPRKP